MNLNAASQPAQSAALGRLHDIQQQISALYAERDRVYRENPGVTPSEILTRDECHALADNGFQVDRIPLEQLGPALVRCPVYAKADMLPAYLTVAEARMIYANRYIAHAGYGTLSVRYHEKKRVEIVVAINGKGA